MVSDFLRRYWFCFFLLFLAPIGSFAGSYLQGAELLPGSIGFFVQVISMFVLPVIVSISLVFIIKVRWLIRLLILITSFFLQFSLFTFFPAGATSEMMGIAYRLKHEYQPSEILDCANNLRRKYQEGTLKVKSKGSQGDIWMTKNSVMVDESELPTNLRGRFTCVFIRPGKNPGESAVVFSLGLMRGIICNDQKYSSDFYTHSMADYVHAYRFERS